MIINLHPLGHMAIFIGSRDLNSDHVSSSKISNYIESCTIERGMCHIDWCIMDCCPRQAFILRQTKPTEFSPLELANTMQGIFLLLLNT